MSADVIQFPSRTRTRVREARLRRLSDGARRYAVPSNRAECVKWFDSANGTWVVDVHSASGDSVGMLGRFLDEAAADRCIARWNAANGFDPRGAA